MTSTARNVLADCEAALGELEAYPAGTEFRLRWVTVVTLLRTVGHALHKVDSKAGASAEATIEARYREWTDRAHSEHAIFRDFIEQERNNILKEYKLGAGQGVNIEVPCVKLERQPDGSLKHVNPDEKGTTTYTYRMKDEPYRNEDPRDVAQQAIDWWHHQLDAIDKQIAAGMGTA